MPQLSIETFVTQYFWLLVVFFSLFILSSLFIIPRIAEIRKTRKLLENIGSVNGINVNNQKSELFLKNYKC